MFKKIVALITTASILSLSTAHADYLYSSDTGGCGYEECRQTPAYTAAIILGAVALAGILAIALQQTSDGGHFH